MKVVSEELGTLEASMAIEHCKVAHRYFWVDLQILNALIRVFHALSLANVTDDPCIEALHLKFQCADTE